MDIYEAWIEHDYNPFVLFDSSAKVVSLNQEAQYLLAEANNKEIFELAKDYANHTYGFKTTIIDLAFGSFKFYAITVGYMDENEIGIKLYKIHNKKFTRIGEQGESVNIYVLLDLCISASSTRSKAVHTKEFDPTFPEIKIEISEFTKLLDKIYQAYKYSDTINTNLSLATGEYIKFENKKYPIFSIKFKGENREDIYDNEIEKTAEKCNCTVRFVGTSIAISSALVTP